MKKMDLKSIQRKILGWCVFELALPVCFAIGIWPLSKFILELSNSYGRLLSNGDLLIIGALILIGCTLDIFFDFKFIFNKSNCVFIIVIVNILIILIFLFVYGFIRTQTLKLTFLQHNIDDDQLIYYANISVVAIFSSCIWAIFAKMVSYFYYIKETKEAKHDT